MPFRPFLSFISRITRLQMPQLTLSSNPGSKSISLSPQKPMARAIRTTARSGVAKKGEQKLHDEENNLAADIQASAREQEATKESKVHDDDMGEGENAKGQPGPAGKRDRSPEGGGVAGSDAKRHKNAYEISECSRHWWIG